MDVSRGSAVWILLHKQLEDAWLVEIVDRSVGPEDGEPGSLGCVLGEDCGWMNVLVHRSPSNLGMSQIHTTRCDTTDFTLASGKLKSDSLGVVIDLLDIGDFQLFGEDKCARY